MTVALTECIKSADVKKQKKDVWFLKLSWLMIVCLILETCQSHIFLVNIKL